MVQFEQKLITVNELQEELPSEHSHNMKPSNKVPGLSLQIDKHEIRRKLLFFFLDFRPLLTSS
jgi:hypothetical protein